MKALGTVCPRQPQSLAHVVRFARSAESMPAQTFEGVTKAETFMQHRTLKETIQGKPLAAPQAAIPITDSRPGCLL